MKREKTEYEWTCDVCGHKTVTEALGRNKFPTGWVELEVVHSDGKPVRRHLCLDCIQAVDALLVERGRLYLKEVV